MVGDYLLWEQILVQVEQRGVDVLLVTGDTKPDWWRLDDKKRPKGPRVELYEELLQRSGRKLRMLAPQNFLDYMKDIFDLSVRPDSLIDVQQVSQPEPSTVTWPIHFDMRAEKARTRLVERYRQYLKSKGFSVAASRRADGSDLSDLHVTRGENEPLYQIYSSGFVSDDPERLDGLRHLLQDTTLEGKHLEQVILFPWLPTDSELDTVREMNAIAVWHSVGRWEGNVPAVEAGLTD